jgi:hypothetical protein
MLDFLIAQLLDDSICTLWLERHLHPHGQICPHCGPSERSLCREQGHFPAYRCRGCVGYYTLLTGIVFAKTRQQPAMLVLLLRGMAKGEPRHASHASWRCYGNSSISCGSVFEAT